MTSIYLHAILMSITSKTKSKLRTKKLSPSVNADRKMRLPKNSLEIYQKTLKSTEEKYKKLFDNSSDAIAIINKKGFFREINEAGIVLFGLNENHLKKQNIFKFISTTSDTKKLAAIFNTPSRVKDFIIKIKNRKNNNIYTCIISVSHKFNSQNIFVFIKDISDQIEMENLVLRTMIETQENERKRFARDIHDTLGQELSAIKFYLSALKSNFEHDKKNQKVLSKTEDALTNMLASIREICFNLMPKTLEKFGLIMAVKEVTNVINKNSDIICTVRSTSNFPRLSSEKEVGIFRIIQEFINNSMKHSKADTIQINFSVRKENILIKMKDNGIGFDIQTKNNFNGMGLKNMESRARSYNGTFQIESDQKGTNFKLIIPIN